MPSPETENVKERSGRKEVREKAFLLVAFFIVGALCFEAGLLSKIWGEEAPLAISIVEGAPSGLSPAENRQEAAVQVPVPSTEKNEVAPDAVNCPFVGSRNSDKYHMPSCSYARRILPANRVCFSTEEEARQKGYTAGCLK